MCNTARFQRKTRHRGALSGAESAHTPQTARKDRIHIEHGATTHFPQQAQATCAPERSRHRSNCAAAKHTRHQICRGERGPGERLCEAGCVLERALPDLASGAEHIARLALPQAVDDSPSEELCDASLCSPRLGAEPSTIAYPPSARSQPHRAWTRRRATPSHTYDIMVAMTVISAEPRHSNG